jgi:hypothetical protein
MYGRKVFQILQKRGIATEAEFNYGTNEHPSAEVYQLAQGRRLSGCSRTHTIDGAKHALVENGPVFIALPLYNSSPEDTPEEPKPLNEDKLAEIRVF